MKKSLVFMALAISMFATSCIINTPPAEVLPDIASCSYLVKSSLSISVCLDNKTSADVCPMLATGPGIGADNYDVLIETTVDATTIDNGINTAGTCAEGGFTVACTITTGNLLSGETISAASQADCDNYVD